VSTSRAGPADEQTRRTRTSRRHRGRRGGRPSVPCEWHGGVVSVHRARTEQGGVRFDALQRPTSPIGSRKRALTGRPDWATDRISNAPKQLKTNATDMMTPVWCLLYYSTLSYLVGWTMVLCVYEKDGPRDDGQKRPCSTLEGGCKEGTLFQVSVHALYRVYNSAWLYAVRVDRLRDETAPSEPVTWAKRRSPCRAEPCLALHSSVRSVPHTLRKQIQFDIKCVVSA
jgi:hypothetical protein